MPATGIALGSNIGDRVANLCAALNGLRALSATAPIAASLYQTTPVGCPDGSPPFLNSVVEIDWPGDPLGILAETQTLESRLGRAANPVRNAPRVIDLDILYHGESQLTSPSLTLPHPRMMLRRFVLMPLAEIRPDFRPAADAPTATHALAELASDEPVPEIFPSPEWDRARHTSRG